MTEWNPEIERNGGPLYVAIVQRLAEDIAQGRVPDGTRLPTHRALARRLGVTVGTVTRAYLEARKRGLTRGEVGRGTFVVAGRTSGPPFGFNAAPGDGLVDLHMNFPPPVAEERFLQRTLDAWRGGGLRPGLLRLQPHAGQPGWREAGADWLRRTGFPADPQQIFVTAGSQHALLLALAVLAEPGDTILAEELCAPGLKAAADLLRLRVRGVAMDEHGVVAEALAQAAAEFGARLVYLVPTLHNPTTRVVPPERRQALAATLARCDLRLIEDDPYALLLDPAPLPIAAAAPERHFYIMGATKILGGGLRLGWLHAPPRFHAALATAMRASVFHAPALSAELAAHWIADGSAEALRRARREEAAARQRLAAALLPAPYAARGESYHLWLPLPAPWTGEDFVAQARQRGVAATMAETFYAGRGRAPQAIRVCLGPPAERAQLERGLRTLAELLAAAPPGWRAAY